VLVAPVRVGDGALVGASSTITREVAPDSIAVTRAEQREIPGAAKRYRERKLAEKARVKAKDG
jgi:bifunctional UDP-N-acetylglucosamine pyrophosphorylase/glucosamine-1-phosphate N-acetyltransferase